MKPLRIFSARGSLTLPETVVSLAAVAGILLAILVTVSGQLGQSAIDGNA